jgi:3-deoxy-D-manno-octulosonic-acid transferase
MVHMFLLYLWSFLISMGVAVARLWAFFRPPLAEHLRDRQLDLRHMHTFEGLAPHATKRVLIFCSSAGEYEQAVPLMEKLEKHVDTVVLIVFFSPSGVKFFKARGDTRHYLLAPRDTLWQWRLVFSAFKPTVTVVVRHELWPAFLTVARAHCTSLVLINVSRSREQPPHLLVRVAKRWLYGFFDQIFCVSAEDARFFQQWYRLPATRVRISGDSKYDRVLLKSAREQAMVEEFRHLFARLAPAVPRLIVGSGWPADIELVLEGLALVRQKRGSGLCCIIALHEPDAAHLAEVEARCRHYGFISRRFSSLQEHLSAGAASPAPLGQDEIVLLDSLGKLSALYGCCQLAWVGGAMHFKVHNVLEPSSYGLALAHGPLYKNSAEAVALVDAGLSTVLQEAHAFARWCEEAGAGRLPEGAAVKNFLEMHRGAVDQLYTAMVNN